MVTFKVFSNGGTLEPVFINTQKQIAGCSVAGCSVSFYDKLSTQSFVHLEIKRVSFLVSCWFEDGMKLNYRSKLLFYFDMSFVKDWLWLLGAKRGVVSSSSVSTACLFVLSALIGCAVSWVTGAGKSSLL